MKSKVKFFLVLSVIMARGLGNLYVQNRYEVGSTQMGYILQLLPIFPVILIITAIAYFIIYKLTQSNKEKPPKIRMFAEFTFVGWGVTFLYITQIMDFGNGLGELVNLQPLYPFYIAFRYGLKNTGMVMQIFLNIIMILPLGFLLPVVFPKKCKSFLSVLAISFSIAFLTELSQLLMGRSADIDDIIANTLGGVLGVALYVIWCSIYYQLSERPKRCIEGISDNRLYCEYYKEVETISPKKSIDIALDVGRGLLEVTAYVSDVKPSYHFNADTGFLIPTWEIQAVYADGNGNEHSWTPKIDAIK